MHPNCDGVFKGWVSNVEQAAFKELFLFKSFSTIGSSCSFMHGVYTRSFRRILKWHHSTSLLSSRVSLCSRITQQSPCRKYCFSTRMSLKHLFVQCGTLSDTTDILYVMRLVLSDVVMTDVRPYLPQNARRSY